jgi:hypothetical protein
MNRISTIIKGLLVLAVVLYGGWLAYKWTVMRVFVPEDKALMVVAKFGAELPPHLIAVPKADEGKYKGVHEELLGPGRYFINPLTHDTKLVDLVQIPAGDPQRWRFDERGSGQLVDPSAQPMVGLIASKQGLAPPVDQEVVDPGYKGIQKEVLTPGTYKINPHLYEVTMVGAIVVPPGYVGVQTRLTGTRADDNLVTLTEIRDSTTGPTTQSVADAAGRGAPSRLVSQENERGVLRDVLQPGIYYVNPRLLKVDVVPVGYDTITLDTVHANGAPAPTPAPAEGGGTRQTSSVRFYSFDGYLVEADFTVVWGISPADAPEIVANIGDWDRVSGNVIEPAMKAACQNVGAKYTSKELIQGDTRSKFQDELSASLEESVRSRNVHVLLALIRNIVIKDPQGKDATTGLLATIQKANIEIERELTNRQKTETAITSARLEEAKKQVDVARETVASETNVKVANVMADAQKKAAEIDAQRDLEVATIQLEVAQLDAQRNQILGKATADVERLRNEAEARGAKMLVDALGSPQAYNLYTFARNFEPRDLRLIFAGEGTFWTDLKSFQEVGATQVLRQGQQQQQQGQQRQDQPASPRPAGR